MSEGFYIRKLELKGRDVEIASVDFIAGLNVIVGPSDTGKTYIAECMDYVLGRGSVPKDIPESKKYESIFVSLDTVDGRYKLERSLRGGDIRIHYADNTTEVLKKKHKAGDEGTVSGFLLAHLGLENKNIRKNKGGVTRTISFRDVSRLIFVDETSVIGKESPVLSGDYLTRTAEISVFRALLTGVDDSGVIAVDDPKVARGRTEGKRDILEQFLESYRRRLIELDVGLESQPLEEKLALAESASESAGNELRLERVVARRVEVKRHSLWVEAREIESRSNVVAELQKRFYLLQSQYASDLRRLGAISEAGLRLDQISQKRCPVCGADSSYHDQEHQNESCKPRDVIQACNAERDKIETLLYELTQTIASNEVEFARLETKRKIILLELESLEIELETLLKPRLQQAMNAFRQNEVLRLKYVKALELIVETQRIEQMIKQVALGGIAGTTERGEWQEFPRRELGELCKTIEALLESWQFPKADRVEFNERDCDILISSRARSSFGKGVRAITRAAFNLALLKYCSESGKSFSRFLLIDSPLVVYREPDSDESGFPLEVKAEFYRVIAKEFADFQVIIIENDAPPDDLINSINVTRFTGSSQGRRGFIPVPG